MYKIINYLLVIFLSLSLAEIGNAEEDHPFGVLIGGVDIQTKVRIAGELKANYYRTTHAIFIGSWKGQNEECEAARAAGLALVLTVRNGKGPGAPSCPPENMDSYKKTLGEILDKYQPVLLVVENEENSAALFYQGTPEQYLAQLKAASEVAHARGIRCTNGGLVSSLVAALIADDYKRKGENQKAEAFLKRTLSEKNLRRYQKGNRLLAEQIAKGQKLLAGYRDAGCDFVNFHWYIDDVEAFHEAVAFCKKATGLPVVCNEMGQQKNESPQQVKDMMQAVVDLKIPVVIWFSEDVKGFGEARALHNGDGSLRPNGKAFKEFIEQRFGK